ncbi:uncharacterized protein BJX67DRAFT_351966, partial [Aspergillus lucknowensis]
MRRNISRTSKYWTAFNDVTTTLVFSWIAPIFWFYSISSLGQLFSFNLRRTRRKVTGVIESVLIVVFAFGS